MNLDDLFNQNIAASKANAGKRNRQNKGSNSANARQQAQSQNSITKSTPAELSGQPSAAYNFVPLTLSPLLSEIDSGAANDQERLANYIRHQQRNDLLSGIIELTIETKTPCYIRLNESVDSFVAPQGEKKEIIPGSTIRGMVKNIFKIVTAGTFRSSTSKTPDGDFSDKYLYFRTMAAKGPIARPYKNEMMGSVRINGKTQGATKAKAGFLFHVADSNQYFIKETTFEKKKDPSLVQQYSVPNNPDAHHGCNGNCIQWNKDNISCFTGEMLDNRGNTKKKYYTIHKRPVNWKNALPVSEEVIQSYKNDTTRRGVNLFEVMRTGEAAQKFADNKQIDEIVPCFFVATDGKVKHFGFGQYYRIPYNVPIGAHVPAEFKADGVDFADAIFGRKELWGSRVAFEDANIIGPRGRTLDHEYSHPLTSPNPTSFQFYLNQTSNNQNDIKMWDDISAQIRGYKLYWHKDISEKAWQKDADESLKDQLEITPIAKGWKFKSKIHFTNLSPVELGALLKVFELAEKDKNCCFKLGQGKALGLGSVRIDSVLKVSKKDRYQTLFGADKTFNETFSVKPISNYVTLFDTYRDEEFDDKNKDAYKTALNELAILLSWENVNKKSTSMKVDRFKKREVLPAASEVETR